MKTLNCYLSRYSPQRDCTRVLASSWTLLIATLGASSPANFPLPLSIVHLFSLYLSNHSLSVGACLKSLAQVKQLPLPSPCAWHRWPQGWKQWCCLLLINSCWMLPNTILSFMCLEMASEGNPVEFSVSDSALKRSKLYINCEDILHLLFFYICWLWKGNNFHVDEGNN